MEIDEDKYEDESVFYINHIMTLPVSKNEIKKETRNDPCCRKLFTALQTRSVITDHKSKFILKDGCLLNMIRGKMLGSLQHKILENFIQPMQILCVGKMLQDVCVVERNRQRYRKFCKKLQIF